MIGMRNVRYIKHYVNLFRGVDEQSYITLGGQEQYVLMTGRDVKNPVIIYLHGGPSSPDAFCTYAFADHLTEDFTFVCWDQRGCGRTYYENEDTDPSNETASFDRALEDLDELVDYARERFGQDRVIVMDQGKVVLTGTPKEIFSQVELLRKHRLDVPQVTLLAYELKQKGLDLPDGILSPEELLQNLDTLCGQRKQCDTETALQDTAQAADETARVVHKELRTSHTDEGRTEQIRIEHLNYIYDPGTAYERTALDDISLTIHNGEFIGIIGHTGSGKSTLIQHLNGLNRASSGRLLFSGEDIYSEGYPMRALRFKVGLVFQYPEHQLFESDVLKDVCFGPKNQGLSEEEALARAREAMRSVGLDESFEKKSPFDLSGGQKRRAAIAGILAMDPEVLVLDEPTAGLDPKGRDEILDLLKSLHEERNITIILVSHSMEDVANYVSRIIVMDEGRILYDDVPEKVFIHVKELESVGLAAPRVTYIMDALRRDSWDVDASVTTIAQARDEILRALGR